MKQLLSIFLLLALALAACTPVPTQDITTFEECVAAGNPVMESYPRQCRAQGQTFVEEVPGEPKVGTENPAVLAVKAYANETLGADEIAVLNVSEAQWPDACLGLAAQGEMCAQVITPGYEIVIETDKTMRTLRTSKEGQIIKEE